jgi:hypothetical protein
LGTLGQLVKIPGIAWESFDARELERSAVAVKQELDALEFFDFVDIRRGIISEISIQIKSQNTFLVIK